MQEAMDALVMARPNAFGAALDRAVAAFHDGPSAEHPPYFPWSSDLLPQCFAISNLGDKVSGLEFKSNPVLAHRVMCMAALFYRVGWRSLDLAAIRWCKNLLRASLPSNLPSAAAKDLIQARIHIVAMIRGRPASENFKH
jgi:hypothetical protein